MDVLEIEPQQLRMEDGLHVRSCSIKNHGTPKSVKELWFKFDQSVPPPDDEDCNSYLLAVVMDAMLQNSPIHINGRVSLRLLSNLVEFQSAWSKWSPGLYHEVEITADTIEGDDRPRPGAICAFSGGVDATFSVWRHSQRRCSHRSQAVNLCALVHGFDIPLSNEKAYRSNFLRAQGTLADLGIPLAQIKTNYREIARSRWQHSFSCALVAVLSNLKMAAGTCIIGSSEPYDSLVIPWGSSPVTDHLLSSGEFEVIHDGASHSRTEKVKEITSWSAGTNNLRVCWEGELKDGNCCACEKCVRTILNFRASGKPVPACLENPALDDALSKVRLRNPAVRAEWMQIYEHAKANKIDPKLLGRIERVIYPKPRLRDILLPAESRRRAYAKQFLRVVTP